MDEILNCMKSIKQYLSVGLFIMLFFVVFCSLKATEHFHVALFAFQ